MLNSKVKVVGQSSQLRPENVAKVVDATSSEGFRVACVCFSCCNSCCGLCWTGDLFDYHLLWSRLSSQVTDCSSLAAVQVIDVHV